MKKYTYRKFLILLFMINLIAITAVYIKYCNARLPDTIHINKSETVSLNSMHSYVQKSVHRFHLNVRSDSLFSL